MKIVIIDDEISATKILNKILLEIDSNYDIYPFNDSFSALKFIKDNKIDIVFSDIRMPELNGIDLFEKIKNINSNINLIYTTGYDEYAIEAINLHASSYIRKPIKKTDIKNALDNLLYEVNDKRIFVKTNGNFDIYVDGKEMVFKRKICKKLLAYLIDRKGSCATRKEIASFIFDNEPYTRAKQTYFTMIIQSLQETLSQYNIDDLLIKEPNSYRINTKLYYDDYSGENSEYMSQYFAK